MARAGRLAGAIVVATEEGGAPSWYLVGDTKVPCDWGAAGFEAPPVVRDAKVQRCVALKATGSPALSGPTLRFPLEGEGAARILADRLLVARNGSVSERLWRLLFGEDGEGVAGELDAAWLVAVPDRVWDVVRDAVLKCT